MTEIDPAGEPVEQDHPTPPGLDVQLAHELIEKAAGLGCRWSARTGCWPVGCQKSGRGPCGCAGAGRATAGGGDRHARGRRGAFSSHRSSSWPMPMSTCWPPPSDGYSTGSDSLDLQQRSTSSSPPRAGGAGAGCVSSRRSSRLRLLADGLCKGEEPVRVVPVFDLLQPPIVRSVVRLLPVGEARIDVVLVRLP